MKLLKKVLLIYKKSSYSIHFLERKIKLTKRQKAILRSELVRYKRAHEEHHASLRLIEQALKRNGIDYDKRSRGSKIDYKQYDFIITVGGDGSFLETARSVDDQIMIGINSAPSFSVGKLCAGHAGDLERIMRGVLDNKYTVCYWPRLRLKIDKNPRTIDCVNDCLVAHGNPAAVSRYRLKIGRITEEHRNSGLWISTAAGSTGAISSAGGKMYKPHEKLIQYLPRELYYGFSKSYRLKGGVLRKRAKLTVTSLMHNGMIFADGTHINLRFPFNSKLRVALSPSPIRTIRVA